ncbi:MAG: hypothetical protein JRG86_15755 [Deltaproteobacteria bacterium]|jgi:hypothetical protein|nr:hypothetical protein [Deltaproteobacteria bacterium]MBW2498743.1 hypothetical protein [Deltaproteobacteria bacterium]
MMSRLGGGLEAIAIYIWLDAVAARAPEPVGSPNELNLLLSVVEVSLLVVTAALRKALATPSDYEECDAEILLPDCCGITALSCGEVIEDEARERSR